MLAKRGFTISIGIVKSLQHGMPRHYGGSLLFLQQQIKIGVNFGGGLGIGGVL
jgi:hypothetical protein